MTRANRLLGCGTLALALAVACFESDPFLPVTAVEFTPPAVYSTWWQMAQSCSGRSGDYTGVRWFTVPTEVTLRNDPNAVAYWSSAGNHIVLHEDRKYDGPTIRHEMLHALVRDATHSREFFLDKCAGFVACNGNCVSEAGKAVVPPNTPFVTADQLLVEVKVSDPFEIMNSGNDWFAVTVTARNPLDHTVTADLTATHAVPGGGISFGYTFMRGSSVYSSGNIITTDLGLLTFAPGQSRVQVFDFFKSQMLQDLLQVTGSFGTNRSTPQSIDTR